MVVPRSRRSFLGNGREFGDRTRALGDEAFRSMPGHGAGVRGSRCDGRGRAAAAATPQTLNLKVLLIGEGSADPTTAAWASALSNEGVPSTRSPPRARPGSETVSLPALSSGSTGNYNGVVIADSPTDYAAGR